MNGEKLDYYFKKYSLSLQNVSFSRLGKYFHDNSLRPLSNVYLCPVCLVKKIGLVEIGELRGEDDFTIDHFPPACVGGKATVLVCTECNNNAGRKFEKSIAHWLKLQAFKSRAPNTEIPITLTFEEVKGCYRGALRIGDNDSYVFENFNYPYVVDWFEKLRNGSSGIQTISVRPPKMDEVYRTLIKTAYLYCFSIWGYDFTHSITGNRMRELIHGKAQSVLTNWGCFFHMKGKSPPSGLCYVFKPKEQQCFLINIELTTPDKQFHCNVSILVPGADVESWEQLSVFQSIIDSQSTFEMAMIKLPENSLSDNNMFPFTTLWSTRSALRIEGEF